MPSDDEALIYYSFRCSPLSSPGVLENSEPGVAEAQPATGPDEPGGREHPQGLPQRLFHLWQAGGLQNEASAHPEGRALHLQRPVHTGTAAYPRGAGEEEGGGGGLDKGQGWRW